MTKTLTLLKTRFEGSGGAEKYARVLAQTFHNRGYAVTVLTTGPVTRTYPFAIHTHSYKSRLSVSKLWEFEGFCEKHLRNCPSNIILGLDRNRLQTHLRASSGVHKAYLKHRRHFDPPLKRLAHLANPLHSSLLHMEKMGFQNPDLRVLFTNSHLVKQEILDHYVVDEAIIHVIHNGVEWSAWETPFQETPFSRDRFTFLFIGSDFKRKGLPLLLSALEQLDEEVECIVVGHDKNLSWYRTRYGHLATFTGHQDSILPYLQKADCLVIPSYYDPFANVTVEALAMGLFVVSSKTNGACEILTPETGTLIEDLSSQDALVSALKKALRHPKTPLRAKLIRKSVQHLDFSKQLDRYVSLC